MKMRLLRSQALWAMAGVVLLVGALGLLLSQQALAEPGQQQAQVGQEVIDRLQIETEVPVVIALRSPPTLEAVPLEALPATKAGLVDVATLQAEVASIGDSVLADLTPADFKLHRQFEAVPAMMGMVTESGLQKLLADPNVRRIDLPAGGAVHLAQSVPLINADDMHTAGHTGAGVVVAVLDSGLDTNHADLGGDLLAPQECFNIGPDGIVNGVGGCPNGSDRQSGLGAAEDDNGHGTSVTGIVTSTGTVSSIGVAPDADIAAYKVTDAGGLFYSFTLDIVAALNDIILNRPEVDVINMSVGTHALFPGNCDNDTAWTMAGAAAINTLRANGVISFAASGNSFSGTQMSAPACLSNVVAVGATDKADNVADFTNSNATLDIMAPGVNITSTGLANGTATGSGTSFASPHAAGCAALFIQAGVAMTPNAIETRLEDSPVTVTDTTNGLQFPRIDCAPGPVERGLAWLRGQQNANGSWTYEGRYGEWESVGLAALAALAFLNRGIGESDPDVAAAITWILSNRDPVDGSIESGTQNPIYETAMAIFPLVATHNPAYQGVIDDAVDYLVSAQNDEGEGLSPSDPIYGALYGGWGYESDTPWWSDLSNTQFALMALDAAELDPASPVWAKAVTFISRCQNLASNPHGFHDDGGFIYSPGEDYWWAGGQSYGSMTAAGVWSLLLSDLPVADARLQAALNWLDNLHYHVDQNYPIGNLWLYYYDLTLAKLHAMAEASGWTSGHPWYDDVSDFLVGNQEADGHWPNIEGDESCDVLTTVEAIMALEVRKIPTSVQRFSWLTFILRSNADLHVYDPLGRHVGMNYDTGEMEIEIPGATFNVDGAQTIQIPGLVAGTYRVRAVGTGTGSYELTVRGGVGDTVLEDETYVETITPATRHDARVMVAMIVGLEIDAVAPPSAVGGIVEIPVSASDAPASAANASGSSSPPYAAIAGAAATAALALTAGGWYARRRWLR